MGKVLKKINRNFQKKIKKLFSKLFILFHGKINEFIDAKDTNKIEIKTIESEGNKFYKIYKINDGRIYTNRVDDTAIIIDNKIVEGPSYQLRADINDIKSLRNNTHSKNNIVMEIGTPRFKRKIYGSVLSLLSGGGANKNYFHWLYDVLPRIGIYEKSYNKENINFYLFPDIDLKFQKETINLLGIKKKQILSSRIFRHIVCDQIIVTDHPYNFTNNTLVDQENVPSWISSWLREKFLTNQNDHSQKIYIDRSDYENNFENRGIVNEDALKKMLNNFGFKFIKLANISFSDQVKIFNSAKIIIGLHGAGLANLAFCKPQTKVIEFRTLSTPSLYENIAKKNNLEYISLKYKPIQNEDKQNGLIRISDSDIKNLL